MRGYLLAGAAGVLLWSLTVRLAYLLASRPCHGLRRGCQQCQAVADAAFTRAAHFCPDCNTDAHRLPRLRWAVWKAVRPW